MPTKRKTKVRKSCASGRAYASGKKKDQCVPKAGKARTKTRGCYARTREDGIRKLRAYRKRLRAGKLATKAARAANTAAYTPSKSWGRENKEAGAFWGLGGHRRKRRR